TQKGPDEAVQKQELICREQASDLDFEIIKTFCDSGVSGISENRAGLNSLFAFLRQYGKAITVFISSSDRLARDFCILSSLEKKISYLNASLVYVNEGIKERI
ncbi:MAG: recombinase family protein, partial [Alphaproteobacteria bacterium]|nr:recombinase family protein [Alphaproteobacteria bacterium]